MKVYGANKTHKILVVGDQPAVLISLRTMLSMRSIYVIATDEPEAAIRLAQTVHADIVLAMVDVCTIKMDPRELADRLRAERPGLKVLFFSSLVDGVVIRLEIVDPDGGVLHQEGVIKAIEEALSYKLPMQQPMTMSAGGAFNFPT